MKTTALSALTLVNVEARYGSCVVLKNLTGTFEKGSLTAIVGPNGGGKSTLLKTLMGFISPSKGSFTHSSKKTAYLPQRSEIDLQFPLTVEQVVSYGLWQEIGMCSSFKPIHYGRIQGALSAVGMEEYQKSHLNMLSGGQLQRVLFARLILQDADLIFLDEPFTGIDSKTTHDLMAIVKQWHQKGCTVIAVLHDLELVKRHFTETLLLATKSIGWGKTEFVLTPESLQKIHVCSHSFSFA